VCVVEAPEEVVVGDAEEPVDEPVVNAVFVAMLPLGNCATPDANPSYGYA